MKLIDRVLKEFEYGPGTVGTIADALGVGAKVPGGSISRLREIGLIEVAGTQAFLDTAGHRQHCSVYRITQRGYAKLMGTLAA